MISYIEVICDIWTIELSKYSGHLPPATEVTTFQHNCSMKPCVITMIHVPSIYPTAKGQKWDWKEATFRAYIDNEAKASIELSLREVNFDKEYKLRNIFDVVWREFYSTY